MDGEDLKILESFSSNGYKNFETYPMAERAMIPDAFVFENLDPKVWEQKLVEWVKQLIGPVCQQVIPIDGKSLRGSDHAWKRGE